MSDKRREIIIAEIHYWKKSKLLPAHYCDYLLTLYTGGVEEEKVENISEKDSLYNRTKTKAWNRILLLAIVGVIITLTMFFSTKHPGITLLASTLFTLLLFSLAWLKKPSKAYDARPAYYTLGALMLLFTTLHLWEAFFGDTMAILIAILMTNCLVWLVIGRRKRLTYFTISGFVGLIFVVLFVLFRLGN